MNDSKEGVEATKKDTNGLKTSTAAVPSVQGDTRSAATPILLASAEQDGTIVDVQQAWGILRHPNLLKEIANLSPEEIESINRLAANLVEDIRTQSDAVFAANTKQNGSIEESKTGTSEEHHAFSVLPGRASGAAELNNLLMETIHVNNPNLLGSAVSLGDSNSTGWNAKIFAHPNDPKRSVIVLNTKVPRGNSYGEANPSHGRAVGCSMIITVSNDSLILALLRNSPEHARQLPFIVRNAAVTLNKDSSLLHFDAPIGSSEGLMGEKEHRVRVADFRTLTLARTTDKPDATAQINPNLTPADFAMKAEEFIGRSITVRRTRTVAKTVPGKFWGTRTVMEEESFDAPISEAKPPATLKEIQERYNIFIFTKGSKWS